MTLTFDQKRNKNIKQTKPIIKTNTQPNEEFNSSHSAITKSTKENYNLLQKINRKWICTNS